VAKAPSSGVTCRPSAVGGVSRQAETSLAFLLGRATRCAPMRPAEPRPSRSASLSNQVRESLSRGSSVPALTPAREASIRAQLLQSLTTAEGVREREIGTGVA